MISYAQNFEDVVLERVFHEIERGFYVDVGANDPDTYSITRHFYSRGWRGINIEPGLVFEKLQSARTRDINLNIAASDRTADVTFYEYPGANGLGGISPEVSEQCRPYANRRFSRTVHTMPLREILEQHAPRVIDFLSVDVEGHEREVLLGNDWTRFRPRVVLVEATLPLTSVPCHDRWEDVLLNADYLFAYFDGLNRFYVRKEDEALLARFSTPPNVFDEFVPAELSELRNRVRTLECELRGMTDHRDELALACAQVTQRLRNLEAQFAGIGDRSLRLGLRVAKILTSLRGMLRWSKPTVMADAVVRSWRVAVGRPLERARSMAAR